MYVVTIRSSAISRFRRPAAACSATRRAPGPVVLSYEERPDEADARFARALETFARFRLPADEADALRQWGLALARAGERAGAQAKLEAAGEIYRRIGAGTPWLERVEHLPSGPP